ncbi:MAG: energy transducer TonB [Enterobacteriaceae bacterium]|nr:energy transducer TonB [Enterobacteriaceae bacterium]
MTQIVYAGEPGIAGNNPFSTKKMRRVFSYSERGLALAAALGLHAVLLPWLFTEPPAVPPLSAPQALPMEIALAAQPVVAEPPPVLEPEPVAEPERAPPEVDENAVAPAKPENPPEVKAKPRPVKKIHAPKPQPPTSVANNSPPASTATASPVPPVATLTPPSANANYLHNPAPEYPESAINRGLEGTVLLKVQVNAAGKATDVQIYKSSGASALDEAALGTVRRWSFVPAKRGSEAISGQVIVPIDFSLNS